VGEGLDQRLYHRGHGGFTEDTGEIWDWFGPVVNFYVMIFMSGFLCNDFWCDDLLW
jgi:hypothetical protein